MSVLLTWMTVTRMLTVPIFLARTPAPVEMDIQEMVRLAQV